MLKQHANSVPDKQQIAADKLANKQNKQVYKFVARQITCNVI